ncbi:CheY-like superfamily [Propionibacterium ruminifibrarum]|uniref:CheY-like superfamily n=1 Tax=Propionibacterium ruminifibrarum TaxID=1962131 RepID=A0A375I436_9ACTN|nr:response regulator transcription factor [Propionibacterium ruminifibrarum]SPF68894.1 CheY-like superfamily [Propionibacterium ruminifibrarum]
MRVLIVDDDAIVAGSLATILDAEDDIEVAGTAGSGPEAVELHARERPDIWLMDIQMPAGDGLAAAERILAGDEQARIVFLTTFSDDEYIVRALRMGARGYLIKQDVARIAPALRSVMAGMRVLEGEVLERTAALSTGGTAGSSRNGAFSALTDREYEVVEAVCEGLDNAEIAERLFMSEGTVRNHISAVLAKLGLRNRTQIAVLYYRAGS